jgi:hypothetical protein
LVENKKDKHLAKKERPDAIHDPLHMIGVENIFPVVFYHDVARSEIA